MLSFIYYTGDCVLRIVHLLVDNGMNVSSNKTINYNPFGVLKLYTCDHLIDIIKLLIEKDPSSVHYTYTVGVNCHIMLCQNALPRSGLIDIKKSGDF